MEHFYEAFEIAHTDGALGASVFHKGTIHIPELKNYLRSKGVCIRDYRYFHGFQSIDELDFEKVDGLMPAIVQDCQTGQVLMMGYMTKESLQKTLDTGFVTFFSRTRQKLWTKGEESGHFLHMRINHL